VDQRFGRIGLAGVGGDGQGAAGMFVVDRRGDGLDVLRLAAADDDAGTRRDIGAGNRLANPTRATTDDGDLAAEIKWLQG
jgi:hypothetical protein